MVFPASYRDAGQIGRSKYFLEFYDILNRSMDKKYLVMVVEDEKLLLQAILRKLELAGFEVEGFSDGNLALDRLKPKDKLPDLIWLDYYLGDLTGDVFLRSMKEILGKEYWIPVMVVSNSASPQKVEETLKGGADKYFLKAEHKLEDLVGIAKEMVGNKTE